MKLSALLAEMIGVFALCLVGAGSIMIAAHLGDKGPGLVGVALAHGLILSIAISGAMNVSGGHINPAVTTAMLLTGRIGLGAAAAYIVAQLVGGMLAGILCFSFVFKNIDGPGGADVVRTTHNGTPFYDWRTLGADDRYLPTTTRPDQQADMKQRALVKAFALEAAMTFLLVMAVFGTAVDPRRPNVGGFGVGLTLTACIFLGGPLTGAALNPARWFGTGIVTMEEEVLNQAVVYTLGPIVGAVIAAMLYQFFILERKTEPVRA